MKKIISIIILSGFSIMSFAQPTVKKSPVSKTSFSILNSGLFGGKYIAGKIPANTPVLLLDHENQKIYKGKTLAARLMKDEFTSYMVTPVDKKWDEYIGGLNTIVLNPASDQYRLLKADTIYSAAEKESLAKMLTDSMFIDKKFKATIVDKNSKSYKDEIYKETKTSLSNRSFKAFHFSTDSISLMVIQFPNVAFMKSGETVVYLPGFSDFYRINCFTLGNEMFIDFPGLVTGDINNPKCETAGSRVYQVFPSKIIEKKYTCF